MPVMMSPYYSQALIYDILPPCHNNNRLFTAPHLERVQSAYNDIMVTLIYVLLVSMGVSSAEQELSKAKVNRQS